MAKRGKSFQLQPEHPCVILCEGKDEDMFLRYYIKYLVEKNLVSDSFYIIDLGGNEDMKKRIPILSSLDNFDQMKGFLVVRDAERDAISAAQSIQKTLNTSFSIAIPTTGEFVKNQDGIQFGFVLLPGKKEDGTFDNGTLEDLCCKILALPGDKTSDFDLLDMAKSYIKDVEGKREKSFRTVHKNRLHAYFSGTDEFVGMKIGEAAQANCFDFSSESLDVLKDALMQLAPYRKDGACI